MPKSKQERAWENAGVLSGYDPDEYRSDYRNSPIRFDDYEKRDSIYGWTIERRELDGTGRLVPVRFTPEGKPASDQQPSDATPDRPGGVVKKG